MNWIKCSDRLPEDLEIIVVFTKNKIIDICMSFARKHGYFSTYLKYRDVDSHELHDITHWMPMPEPPEDE